jgi:hypothetical protein
MAVVDTGELYALPPEQFTAARDEAARQAKADGDPDAAKALKALRRPSVAAWLVNRLAADQADLLEQLLALGPALAQAQAGGHVDQLRALGQQRRQLVEAVADAAVGVSGRGVGTAVRDEVVGTLEAALADPASGQAVRSGRLVRALSYAGFGGVDLADAVAEPGTELPGRAFGKGEGSKGKGGKDKGGKDNGGEDSGGEDSGGSAEGSSGDARRARSTEDSAARQRAQRAEQQARERIAAAERQALEAAGKLDDAVRAAERAERDAGAAVAVAEHADSQVTAAAEALAVAERQRDEARARREQAAEAAEVARDAVRHAQDRADEARSELDRLRRS